MDNISKSNKSLTTVEIRQLNKNKIFNYIFENKITCRINISHDLNLGFTTITNILKSLEDENLIIKNGHFNSTGGRKASAIEINKRSRISIGVSILKDSFDIVATDLYGDIVSTKNVWVPFKQDQNYFETVGESIDDFIIDDELENILGVSIAIQSIVSEDGKSIKYGKILENNFLELSDFEAHIKYPCRIEHDSKAAANLELWRNDSIKNGIVFLLNENLGGAIISNGKVQHGNNMRCGIIEHLIINPQGDSCYCGQKGCLETLCSANALKKNAKLEIKDFFKEVRNDNEIYTKIWTDYLTNLSTAIRNLYTILDGTIILSGFLATYFTKADLKFILDFVNSSSSFKLNIDDLILSIDGNYTQAIGTSLYYISQFLKEI